MGRPRLRDPAGMDRGGPRRLQGGRHPAAIGGDTVRTGPQKYPGASTAYWHQDDYPGSAMETNVILWHTTEGTTLPPYGGGASGPEPKATPDVDVPQRGGK